MKNIEKQVNLTFNKAVYLQLMAALDPISDWSKFKDIVISTHSFFKESPREEITEKIEEIDSYLSKMVEQYQLRFPPKKSVDEIADSWNSCFKNDKNPFQNGITFGWLNKLMNIDELKLYKDVPYHFKIGLVTHKGFGGVEEDFLLKDAFHVLIKAHKYYDLLKTYAAKEKIKQIAADRIEFDKNTYRNISDIKFEISSYSRLGIISFYAFLEGFVNSVGYSFRKNNIDRLNPNEKEILEGLKNGRHISLRQKLEKFQRIIRKDKKVILITTDNAQTEFFVKEFFNVYENLRNSSVHFSPTKEPIWMKPDDWLEKINNFSKITLKIALQFWKSCYETNEGPYYLNQLDYDDFYIRSKNRLENIVDIKNNMK